MRIMKKVLVISTNSLSANGVTNVIKNYFSEFGCDEFKIDFVFPRIKSRGIYEEFLKRGNIYEIRRDMLHILSYFRGVVNLIKKNKYDIVHIHGNSRITVLELFAAKLAGNNVRIVHAHSTMCKSLVLHKLLKPLFDALCTHRLACGIDAGRFMFGDKPFNAINNGIDTECFSFNESDRNRIRKKYNLQNKIVVGHVGTFVETKNQSFFVDVLAYLQKKTDAYGAMLIGDGPLMGEVKAKARDSAVNDIHFIGCTDCVSEYLSACDIIVMPSLHEGLPLTLIEEQANGLLCVVSDGITKEVDKTGNVKFVSLEAGAERWADEVMSINDDKARCERSAEAIKQIIDSGYSIGQEAAKLKAYYHRIVK